MSVRVIDSPAIWQPGLYIYLVFGATALPPARRSGHDIFTTDVYFISRKKSALFLKRAFL
jgi:hypothetical protein